MSKAANASSTGHGAAAVAAAAAGMAIGIANLPNQTHKIVSRKGATFTIMLVGESGAGKTTFINTLLTTSIKPLRDLARRRENISKKTVTIDVVRAEFKEKSFTTQLNVVDTPGFGDYVNNSRCIEPLIEFLDSQHESYLRQEIQPHRDSIMDGRVHACIYFIPPSGHTLRQIDLEVMKALSSRVNLIPIVSKADTLTTKELTQFKRNIISALHHHGIVTYIPSEEQETFVGFEKTAMAGITEAMPFAVIGSEEEVSVSEGRMARGRSYPWGSVEVENDSHCDFKKLRALLFRSHMLDLITTTEEVHYENFRALHRDQSGKINAVLGKKNSRFKEEEDQLRRKFTEQVKSKEAMFRQWEQKLINERDKLNKDLEQEHGIITALTAEIKSIEERLNSKK